MANYTVKFFKTVMGENGHQAEICQDEVEIDADNFLDATERGKQKFCDNGCLTHWSLYADRISVAETDSP